MGDCKTKMQELNEKYKRMDCFLFEQEFPKCLDSQQRLATLSREGVTLNSALSQVKNNNLWNAGKAILFS